MTPKEFKAFQDGLREDLGNTYTVEVGRILSEDEVIKLTKYIRLQHNDPDATIRILQPIGYEMPDFEFEIVSKNNKPLTQEKTEIHTPTTLEGFTRASDGDDKISRIYGENWIVLQNRLLNAISDLTQDERRFIMFLSPLIRRAVDEHPHQRVFTVIAKDFAKEYEISEKHVYEKLKKISKSIHGKVFYYWNFDANNVKNEKGVSWIGTAEYKDSEGMVEVLLLDEVVYMLTVFDKSNPFTKYERKHIANLGSYGIVLFELISSCMHQQYKSKSYKIEFLRKKFSCTDRYLLTAEFKRNVIDKAIQDVESNIPLRISYEQKKVGRTLTEIIFNFSDSRDEENNLETQAENNHVAFDDKRLFGWQQKGLTDAQIKKLSIHQKEFIDANTSKISPTDRRDYPDIFEDWKTDLKDPKQVNSFNKIQEFLERKKNH